MIKTKEKILKALVAILMIWYCVGFIVSIFL